MTYPNVPHLNPPSLASPGLPYLALPCLALPSLPYLALPYLALPHQALPALPRRNEHRQPWRLSVRYMEHTVLSIFLRSPLANTADIAASVDNVHDVLKAVVAIRVV